MFYGKILLGKSPFGWSPWLPYSFHSKFCHFRQHYKQGPVHFSKLWGPFNFQMTLKCLQKPGRKHKCESSQATIGKVWVRLLKAIQSHFWKTTGTATWSTGLKKITWTIRQDKECNKKATLHGDRLNSSGFFGGQWLEEICLPQSTPGPEQT